MEEQDTSEPQAVPRTVGEQLRASREAMGMSRADIAAKTRVAERHLVALEENRFAAMAAPTYAVGFARAYARAVDLDEGEIARKVRRQLDAQAHVRPEPEARFEPGDPARVPSSRVAWLAAALVIVAVGLVLMFWNSYLSPEGKLPDLLPETAPTIATVTPPAVSAVSQPASGAALTGPIVLTATGPQVWVKITDAAGDQVFQKELAQGETYTVPAGAREPTLRTARPDELQISVGGRLLPMLSDAPKVISGVLLTPTALLERANSFPAGSSVSAAPGPVASPVARQSGSRATNRSNDQPLPLPIGQPAAQRTGQPEPSAAGTIRSTPTQPPKMDDILDGAH